MMNFIYISQLILLFFLNLPQDVLSSSSGNLLSINLLAVAITKDKKGYANRLYVSDQDSGLHILNVENPSDPISLGVYDTEGYSYFLKSHKVLGIANHAFVENNVAFLCDMDHLWIVSVLNPAFMTLIGEVTTPGTIFQVTIHSTNKIAYVSTLLGGLSLVNISSLSSPQLISTYTLTSGQVRITTVIDDVAYIAGVNEGLVILNVSDPSDVFHIATLPTPNYASGLFIEDEILYLTVMGGYGLQIINITNVSNPFVISSHSTPENAYDVVVKDGYAYVADWFGGLQIFDVSNYSNPFPIGNYSTPHYTASLYVEGTPSRHIVYLADGTTGVIILQVDYNVTREAKTIEENPDHTFFIINSIISSIFFLISFVFILTLYFKNISENSYFYLFFSITGLFNVIGDLSFIIYISTSIIYLLPLGFFVLSILLNIFRNYEWKKILLKQSNANDINLFYSRNTYFFNFIIILSLFNPSFLYLLNFSSKFPALEQTTLFSIQCVIYDVFSLLPQSIVLYYIAFSYFNSPFEWDIFIWILLMIKIANQIIAITRALFILLIGGGKSRIFSAKKMKYGIYPTVKKNIPPLITESHSSESNLQLSEISFTESSRSKSESSE